MIKSINRREEFAHKLSVLIHNECDKRVPHDIGLTVAKFIEQHYGDIVLEDAEWEAPDSVWVETLLKMAIERKNVNSSFPNMCRFVLAAMDRDAARALDC